MPTPRNNLAQEQMPLSSPAAGEAFARGLSASGLFFSHHSTHPVRSASFRTFAAKATCARPSTFKQGTRCAALPAFSRSEHSPATAREMAARMESAASVWGSVFVMARTLRAAS